jgi:hypothetical protein
LQAGDYNSPPSIAATANRRDREEPLRHQDFAQHVGKRFRFHGWDSALRLAAVNIHDQAAAPGIARTPFILLFHGPIGNILPEGLYQADIEDGPTLEFYIVPIHTVAPDRQEYQAVFN